MDLKNKKVITFHQLMGAVESARDKKQLYAYLTKSMYKRIKKKFPFFTPCNKNILNFKPRFFTINQKCFNSFFGKLIKCFPKIFNFFNS